MSRPLHIFMGGTFDPVHIGHLRIALDISDLLGAAQVNLLPCHQPVHRGSLGRTPTQRLSMLSLAVANCPQLTVDQRELSRGGDSYTVDTLLQMRTELGEATSIVMVVGQDTFNQFTSWKRWQDIPNIAHVVVVTRPGYHPGHLPESLDACRVFNDSEDALEFIRQETCGSVTYLSLSMLDVSSTEIRQRLVSGKSVKYLLPDPVIDYIQANRLYPS